MLLSRIYEFAQKASADVTIEDVRKRLMVPSTYTQATQNTDKITLGKVERSVEVHCCALLIRTAMDLAGSHLIS